MIKRLLIVIGICVGIAAYCYLSFRIASIIDPEPPMPEWIIISTIAVGVIIIPFCAGVIFMVLSGIYFLGFWIVKGERYCDYEKEKTPIEDDDSDYKTALVALDKEYPGAEG